MKEIRIHGRGGQGMVMASEMVVHAVMIDDLYGNAIPFFGFERRGSPVVSFVRIDDHPIREKTQIYAPDCIVVSDPTLLDSVNVFAGVKENAIMVLNSTKELSDLDLPAQISRLGLVDATGIALEILGLPVTNTAMVGAFAKVTQWIRLESALEGIRRVMPAELAEKNVEAARRAAQKVRIIDMKRKG